jgi:hypothetical protein
MIKSKDFLASYGWGEYFDEILTFLEKNAGILKIIGFDSSVDGNTNIAWLFLSPIIFYITTSIMKDHFQSKL